jgi:hypothetical protein
MNKKVIAIGCQKNIEGLSISPQQLADKLGRMHLKFLKDHRSFDMMQSLTLLYEAKALDVEAIELASASNCFGVNEALTSFLNLMGTSSFVGIRIDDDEAAKGTHAHAMTVVPFQLRGEEGAVLLNTGISDSVTLVLAGEPTILVDQDLARIRTEYRFMYDPKQQVVEVKFVSVSKADGLERTLDTEHIIPARGLDMPAVKRKTSEWLLKSNAPMGRVDYGLDGAKYGTILKVTNEGTCTLTLKKIDETDSERVEIAYEDLFNLDERSKHASFFDEDGFLLPDFMDAIHMDTDLFIDTIERAYKARMSRK